MTTGGAASANLAAVNAPTASNSSPERLPLTAEAVNRGVEVGLHRGAQVSVWSEAGGALDLAFGAARAGVAMTPDTSVLWLSSGKPLLAVAVAQQIAAGRLAFDDAVSDFVPEFAAQGKEEITVEQVLMHTGGFRSVVFDYPAMGWDAAVAAVCNARLETGWVPGETAGYHPHSGWNILGRLIEVCTGDPLGTTLRREVLEPLGMTDAWGGLPESEHARLRKENRLAVVENTALSTPRSTGMDEAAWAAGVRPGGNTWGPARDLARFYRAVLGGGAVGGDPVLPAALLTQLTERVRRDTVDRTFRATMDWGRGFMVNNRRHDAANAETHGASGTPYNFGPHAGDDAVGHGGNQSSIGFADPAHGLAVAVVFNGMCGEPKHQRRMVEVLDALYLDLGLV